MKNRDIYIQIIPNGTGWDGIWARKTEIMGTFVKKMMKSKQILLLFILLLLYSVENKAQAFDSELLIQFQYVEDCDDDGEWNNHNNSQPRMPQPYQVIPFVTLDNTGNIISFYGNAEMPPFTYYIKDDTGNIFYSDMMTLQEGQEQFVDISALPTGNYEIILDVSGKRYVGYFTSD